MEPQQDTAESLELFQSSLELVDIIARKLARSLGRIGDLDDLRAYGREGLLHAARRFDPSQGVPFAAYATFRVRGAMIDGIRKSAQLPRRVHEKLRMMSAADGYSESAGPDAVSEASNASRGDAQRLLDDHLARMATAIAVGMVGPAAFGDAGELIGVSRDPSPEQMLEREQLRALLSEGVEELPEQEAELVRRHYFEGERFDHVAADLGLSKSWASRLHTRAIGRLTKRLRQRV